MTTKSISDQTEQKQKHIVLAGGGTGGHIYPCLALVDDLKSHNFKISYIGEKDSLEEKLAKQHKLDFYAVSAIKFKRGLSIDNLKNNLQIPTKLCSATDESKHILQKIGADVIFSKGGFVSLPTALAGLKLGIPTLAHESDVTLGLANRIASLFGAKMLKGNPKSTFKGTYVGIPLRKDLFAISKKDAKAKLGITSRKKVVLVVGGSSGAKTLNRAIADNLSTLTKHYYVILIAGKDKADFDKYLSQQMDNFDSQNCTKNSTATVTNESDKKSNTAKSKSKTDSLKGSKSNSSSPKQDNFLCIDYAKNINIYLNSADMIISRAGATAIAEISALKKRALFVPLSNNSSRGDQVLNAEIAREYGANTIDDDQNLQANLVSAIDTTMQNSPMRPIETNANRNILTEICDSLS